jgi:hypothetical protein
MERNDGLAASKNESHAREMRNIAPSGAPREFVPGGVRFARASATIRT